MAGTVTATTTVLDLPVQSAYTPTTLLYGVTPTNLSTGTNTAVAESTIVNAAVALAQGNDQVILAMAEAYTDTQITATLTAHFNITGIDGGTP